MERGGIIALGDSLINADQSWAFWVADATGLKLDRRSVGGATSTHTLRQIQDLPEARIALVSVGVNDVLFDWRPDTFTANLSQILNASTNAAIHTAIHTLPLHLDSFFGSGNKTQSRVVEANRTISAQARKHGAHVIDGSDLRGPLQMSGDRIHPTVYGQQILAKRALEALEIDHPPLTKTVHARPSTTETMHRTARAVAKRMLRYQPPPIRY